MKKIAKFLLVGMVNTVSGLAVIYGCMIFFKISPYIANVLGYMCGVLLGFYLHRNWVFDSKAKFSSAIYGLVVACAYFLNLFVLYAFIDLCKLNNYLSQILGIVVYTSTVYIGCRFMAFRK